MSESVKTDFKKCFNPVSGFTHGDERLQHTMSEMKNNKVI